MNRYEIAMIHAVPAYGLWMLVIINSAVFIIFAFNFTGPRTRRDWRALGSFAAFIVALFTEMYGAPLTIFLLSGWLGRRYPGLDPFSYEAGHLWDTLIGWKGDAHFSPFHLLSNILIVGGLILLASAWRVLHQAERTHTLATTGPYARVRHPQYLAFILIMLGFLLQWPTLITLAVPDPGVDVRPAGEAGGAPNAGRDRKGLCGIRGKVRSARVALEAHRTFRRIGQLTDGPAGAINMQDVYVEKMTGPTTEEGPLEIVERKGLGHPDTICDSVMDRVSRALCRAYLEDHRVWS